MNAVQPIRADAGEIMESVIAKGDLGKLTPEERSHYYSAVCQSVGLNPMTQPFAYITLNGKLTLYATRNCTDQLRTIHRVSVEELTESERDGVFVVTAKVRNGEGRTDMAKGAVTITGLKGDNLANALMKAETKAKRRATLSICGLGFLDESEIETIPAAAKARPEQIKLAPPAPVITTLIDPETGEVGPHAIELKMNGEKVDWVGFTKAFGAALNAADSAGEIDAWHKANVSTLGDMTERAPKMLAAIMGLTQQRLVALEQTIIDAG